MSKIAIVTDSNSGITQAQAKEMGVSVLPMPFMIDEETYYEDFKIEACFTDSGRQAGRFCQSTHGFSGKDDND